MITNLVTSATRREVEDSWRLRLEETHVRYRQATQHYRELLEAQLEATPYNPNGALALARQAESQALSEYVRVLKIFTELTVNGQMPNHQSVGGSDGV